MRKIFELSASQFLSGIAPSSQLQNKGIFHKALGIDPVFTDFAESDITGLLQAGVAATSIGGTTVTDIPWAYATDVSGTSTENLYIYGNGGFVYKIDLSSELTVSCLNPSAAISSPAAGAFFMHFSDGSKKLFLFTLTGLYQYGDIAGTPSFSSASSGVLQSTPWHPPHRFFDRVYFGNGRYIGWYAEDPASAGFLTQVYQALDFPAEYRVNSLSDDGTYLVAGISNVSSTDTLSRGTSKVIFWDTSQDSWQREWEIPDATIYSVRKVGTAMEAVTSRGVFVFTFYSPPQLIIPYQVATYMPNYSYPTHHAAAVVGQALAWGGDGQISTFGKIQPSVPAAHLMPFAGMTGYVTMLASDVKTGRIFVGTSSNKLYTIIMGTGTRQTGVQAETIYLDLARWWQVRRIDIEFDGQLASGDDVSLKVQKDDKASAATWASATYAANGAIRNIPLYGSVEARKLKTIVQFNGGAASIRNISVWGDPIETPTHTRA